jgi:tetraacyldisaccharide 4'-kinase
MKFKKPIFWDYKKPNYLSYLLLPLTLPVIINNFFLNLKKKKIDEKIKKICIGNIYVGGTAKTPLTIKIYRILSDLKFKTATIKKFYKKHYDEQEILSQETKLYCNKNRVDALDEAIKDNVAVAIFDDGLQDKSMDYDLKFVCFNNSKWVGNGFLIPAGPLRETISSLSKYDSVFLNGNEKDNSDIKMLLKKYNKEIQIFEATYKVINLNKLDIKKKYVIFSGIGNPDSFKETLTKHNFNIVKEIIFPDHYNYTPKDIDYIRLQAKKLDSKILTTEKDYIKIKTDSKKDINFLKIDLNIKDESKLIDYLKLHI